MKPAGMAALMLEAFRNIMWAAWRPRTALGLLIDKLSKPIGETLSRYRETATQNAAGARSIALKGAAVSLCLFVILWISIFIYVAFYYTYMPNITHSRPVHFQFKSCDEAKGICSFPSAHVRLTKRQQLLMVGQAYKITIDIEMPESETNKNLGMFMCCAEMRTRSGSLVSSSCRSGLLLYKSQLLTTIMTLVKAPMLIFEMQKEKQTVHLELYSHFEDDKNQPVTDVYVEIQSRHIEIYSATLNIDAHFTGLRYFMFHWPYISAAIGVTTNLLFMVMIFALSWYHLQLERDEEVVEPIIKGEDKPFVGGKESMIFDNDDLTPDALNIKREDESQTSDDMSVVEDSTTEDDKIINVEE